MEKLNSKITKIYERVKTLGEMSDPISAAGIPIEFKNEIDSFKKDYKIIYDKTKTIIKEKTSKASNWILKFVIYSVLLLVLILGVMILVIVIRMKRAIHNKRAY